MVQMEKPEQFPKVGVNQSITSRQSKMAGIGSIFTLHQSKGSLVEGIGDEVLLGLVSSLLLIGVVSIIYRNHVRTRNIHPLQEEQVQITRDRLGVGREDATQGDTNEQAEHVSQPPRPFSAERHCPVCLTDARYLTMTNCGHEFCGKSGIVCIKDCYVLITNSDVMEMLTLSSIFF